MSLEVPIVEPWSPESGITPSHIATAHLAVRLNQVIRGTNIFADIYDSQVDLVGLQSHYIDGGGNVFIARSGDQLQGLVALRNDGNRHATLRRLGVLPQFEGMGNGKNLVRTLINWASENGFDTIGLQTGGDEDAKTRVYEKAGFVVTGTVPKEHKSDEWLMELVL